MIELSEGLRAKTAASIDVMTRAGLSMALLLSTVACSLPPIPPLPGQPTASPEPSKPAAAAKPSPAAAIENSCPSFAARHDFSGPFDFRRTQGEQRRSEDELIKDYEDLRHTLEYYFSRGNDPWFWESLQSANGGTYDAVSKIFASKVSTVPFGTDAQRETISSYLVLQRPEPNSRVLVQRNRFRVPQRNAPDAIIDTSDLYFSPDGKFSCGGATDRLLTPSETLDLAVRVTGLSSGQLRQDDQASAISGVSYDTRDGAKQVALKIKSNRTAELTIHSP